MEYTDSVKARMVRRMLGPSAVTATELATETGIPQPTLSRWLRAAATVKGVSSTNRTPPSTQPPLVPKRPQDWTPLERAGAVLEASQLSEDELGEFLRRKGLHREQLDEWRSALEESLTQARGSRRPSGEAKRIKELERELARKDKALAETAALLVLKKKMALLWGEEDDDTDPRSDK
jgi:transposase